MSSFKDRLKQMKKHWQGAREEAADDSFGASVPDGKYLFWVTCGELGESQSSGRLQFPVKYQVARGEHGGVTLTNYQGVDDPDQLVFVARWLAKMNYELDEVDIENLDEYLEEITGECPLIEAKVKNKDGYCNVQSFSIVVVDPADYDDLIEAGSEAPSSGGMTTNTTTETEEEFSWAAVGQQIEDGEDDSHEDEMIALAESNGIDHASLSWPDLGVKLDELAQTQEDDGNDEPTWSDWGNGIENGDYDADGDEAKQMCDHAVANDLDPDDFTWSDLGAKLDELDTGEGDEDVTADLKKGSKVWGVYRGKTRTGVITKIEGETATVKDDAGEFKIKLERLEADDVPF